MLVFWIVRIIRSGKRKGGLTILVPKVSPITRLSSHRDWIGPDETAKRVRIPLCSCQRFSPLVSSHFPISPFVNSVRDTHTTHFYSSSHLFHLQFHVLLFLGAGYNKHHRVLKNPVALGRRHGLVCMGRRTRCVFSVRLSDRCSRR